MPDDSELLSRLAEEYLSRARSGPPPDVEEFAARHPRLAGRLRELLPKLLDPTVTVAGEEPPPPRPPAPGLTPGTVFGAYRVRRKVGEGGMGVVYEADHLTLDRRVALKVLPAGVLRGGDRLERFLREARTAAGLHHTNIVPIFEVGEVEGTPYFAMQFIDGRGLDQFPPGAVPLPDPQRTAEFRPGAPTPPPPPPAGSSLRGDRYRFVAKVGAQAADALAYAHRRGVVHRDIKPSNLLLDDSGTVWVADFGLARRADDVTLTRSGMLIGTPRYMSPEQADLGGKPVDHRTDVYSLGVTLYELLTGRPPFDGRSSNELLIRILHGEPVPPSRIDPAVPRDLETVILKAMAKRPEDRYPGAEELAADFRRFLNREPVRARRIGPLGRAWRWALRSPAVAGLLAAVVLSLAGGTAAATLLALEARDRQRIAERFAKQAAANETRALEEAGRARTERRRALANLYVAQANLAQTDLREFRTDSLLRRLGEMRPGPGEPDFRGFEWNYLWRAANGADRFRDFRDGSSLYLVALSGDGRRWVRLGGRGGAPLTVRDAATGAAVSAVRGILPDFGRGAPRVALNRDGSLLAVTTRAGVAVWDVERSEPLGTFRTENRVDFVTFGPGGRRLALAERSVAVHVWDPAGGRAEKVFPLRGEFCQWLCFRPDGREVAAALGGREFGQETAARVEVWEVGASGPRVAIPPPEGRRHGPWALAYSPDGRYLAVPRGEGSLALWDLAEDRAALTLPDLPLPFGRVAFSPDGRRVAVGCERGLVAVFDRAHPDRGWLLRARQGEIGELAFPAPGRVVAAGWAGVVEEWALPRAEMVPLPGVSPVRYGGRAEPVFSADGSRLAAVTARPEPGGDGAALELAVWDVETGGERFRWPVGWGSGAPEPQLSHAANVALSPDGSAVALAVSRQWDPSPATRALLSGVPPFSPLGALSARAWRLATRRGPVEVSLFRIGEGRRGSLTGFGPTPELAFSPGGEYLLLTSRGGWEVRDAATFERVLGSGDDRYSSYHCAFGPGGRLAVLDVSIRPVRGEPGASTWTAAAGLTVWDVAGRRVLARVPMPEGVPAMSVTGCRFGPDGTRLLVSGGTVEGRDDRRDGILVWDTTPGRPPELLRSFFWDRSGVPIQPVESFALSADNRLLAAGTAGFDQPARVRVWDLETGAERFEFRARGAGVGFLAFGPDGRRLFSVDQGLSRPGSPELTVWDLETGRELLGVPAGPELADVAGYHFDGQRLRVAGWDDRGGELRLFDGSPVAGAE